MGAGDPGADEAERAGALWVWGEPLMPEVVGLGGVIAIAVEVVHAARFLLRPRYPVERIWAIGEPPPDEVSGLRVDGSARRGLVPAPGMVSAGMPVADFLRGLDRRLAAEEAPPLQSHEVDWLLSWATTEKLVDVLSHVGLVGIILVLGVAWEGASAPVILAAYAVLAVLLELWLRRNPDRVVNDVAEYLLEEREVARKKRGFTAALPSD